MIGDPGRIGGLVMQVSALSVALGLMFLVAYDAPTFAGWDEGAAAYDADDYELAMRELRPLAKQGHARAQYIVGVMYSEGSGVPQDYGETEKWYRMAAAQGHEEAQNDLGFMYGTGEGVPQDYAEAVRWYRMAAEEGFILAQYNLGLMYAGGKGVTQNYVVAHMWFSVGASRWPAGSYGNDAAHNRDILEASMTPAEMAEAKRLAREWIGARR